MQPTDPIPTTTLKPEVPASFGAPTPEITPPVSPTPEKKNHKKLIILIVVGAILLLAGLATAGFFIFNNLTNKGSAAKPVSSTPDTVWTSNPDELYFDNMALFVNGGSPYKEASNDAKKKVLEGGENVCNKIKSENFKADKIYKTDEDAVINILTYGAFATADGSICPEYAGILDKLSEESKDNAFYYGLGKRLLFDNTTTFNNLAIAQDICFVQGTLIFGTAPNSTVEEKEWAQKLSCALMRAPFETDLAYFTWTHEHEDEVSAQLVKFAKQLGLATGICAETNLCKPLDE